MTRLLIKLGLRSGVCHMRVRIRKQNRLFNKQWIYRDAIGYGEWGAMYNAMGRMK